MGVVVEVMMQRYRQTGQRMEWERVDKECHVNSFNGAPAVRRFVAP
jgi:hypothetical protein